MHLLASGWPAILYGRNLLMAISVNVVNGHFIAFGFLYSAFFRIVVPQEMTTITTYKVLSAGFFRTGRTQGDPGIEFHVFIGSLLFILLFHSYIDIIVDVCECK